MRIIAALLAFFLITALALTVFTPFPVSYLARFLFRNGVAVPPADYGEIRLKTEVFKDIAYPSEYSGNTADVYLPKDGAAPYPVVLWVHGGGFVGGDKKDVEVYATALAAEGYAVVCMNYGLAPEEKYPVPVIQTGEAYLWIESAAEEYGFDTDRVVLAGDSAGAHVAAQFAALQSNGGYAGELGQRPLVQNGKIKAVLLFCGPFYVSEIAATGSAAFDFLLGRVAWAYFGTPNWAETFGREATLANHVTDGFPPAFISDGNTGSFEKQGRAFAEDLRRNGVEVETYFPPSDFEVTGHEYQFIMNTPAGMESFRRTLDFLERNVP